MTAPAPADLQRQLESQQAEIAALTAELATTASRVKLHAKRVMKQGMEAFFSGRTQNPYDPTTDDAELWSFGFNLSKDNWDGVRNPAAT